MEFEISAKKMKIKKRLFRSSPQFSIFVFPIAFLLKKTTHFQTIHEIVIVFMTNHRLGMLKYIFIQINNWKRDLLLIVFDDSGCFPKNVLRSERQTIIFGMLTKSTIITFYFNWMGIFCDVHSYEFIAKTRLIHIKWQ